MHTAPTPRDDRYQDMLDKSMRNWEASAWRVLHRLTVHPEYWATLQDRPELPLPIAPRHFPPGDYAIIAQAIEDTLSENEAATFEAIGKAAIDAGVAPETLLALVSPHEDPSLRDLTPEGYLKDAKRLWDAGTRYCMAWLFLEAAREKATTGHLET